MKRVLVILLGIFLLVGYFVLRWRESGIPGEVKRPAAVAALTLAGLRNASFRTVDCGTITLRNGAYAPPDQEARCSIALLEKMAMGDLNSDVTSDAAVLLGTDLGGSGFFVSLAAVLNRNGRSGRKARCGIEDTSHGATIERKGNRRLGWFFPFLSASGGWRNPHVDVGPLDGDGLHLSVSLKQG